MSLDKKISNSISKSIDIPPIERDNNIFNGDKFSILKNKTERNKSKNILKIFSTSKNFRTKEIECKFFQNKTRNAENKNKSKSYVKSFRQLSKSLLNKKKKVFGLAKKNKSINKTEKKEKTNLILNQKI